MQGVHDLCYAHVLFTATTTPTTREYYKIKLLHVYHYENHECVKKFGDMDGLPLKLR